MITPGKGATKPSSSDYFFKNVKTVYRLSREAEKSVYDDSIGVKKKKKRLLILKNIKTISEWTSFNACVSYCQLGWYPQSWFIIASSCNDQTPC